MRWLIAAALAAFLAVPAQAQLGVTGAFSKDWIKVPGSDSFTELASPMAGVLYDFSVGGDDGEGNATYGLSFGYRAAQDVVLLSSYFGEWWQVRSSFEWFAGGQMETWTLDGKNEFLAGARAGLRLPVIGTDVPFEVSGLWSWGKDGRERRGVTFGLRIVGSGSE